MSELEVKTHVLESHGLPTEVALFGSTSALTFVLRFQPFEAVLRVHARLIALWRRRPTEPAKHGTHRAVCTSMSYHICAVRKFPTAHTRDVNVPKSRMFIEGHVSEAKAAIAAVSVSLLEAPRIYTLALHAFPVFPLALDFV
jgi:hypothetical protein